MRRAKPPSPGSGQGARGGFDARGIRNREAVAARRRIFRVLARQQSAERLLLRVARARSRGERPSPPSAALTPDAASSNHARSPLRAGSRRKSELKNQTSGDVRLPRLEAILDRGPLPRASRRRRRFPARHQKTPPPRPPPASLTKRLLLCSKPSQRFRGGEEPRAGGGARRRVPPPLSQAYPHSTTCDS